MYILRKSEATHREGEPTKAPGYGTREFAMGYGEAQERAKNMTLEEMSKFRRQAIKTMRYTGQTPEMVGFTAGIRKLMERRINRL